MWAVLSRIGSDDTEWSKSASPGPMAPLDLALKYWEPDHTNIDFWSKLELSIKTTRPYIIHIV